MSLTINELNSEIEGQIIANSDFFNKEGFIGRFTFLNDAEDGDIVIRHWINGKGIEIAASKNISCLITQTPKDGALEKAKELNFPLIVVDKIELANAFALKWTVNKYCPNSRNVVITGTNGKSTSSHLIYHILKHSGHRVFTNTDSESEFNTLIDPMVAKLISDDVKNNGDLEFLVIEISEVQGWLGSLMKNHAYLMANAINPEVGVITNIAMDHIGVVNSIDDVYDEIFSYAKAILDGTLVFNHDDNLVMEISNSLKPKKAIYCSMNQLKSSKSNLYYDSNKKAIVYDDMIILNFDELPFTSNHFIQNILSAIASCLALDIPLEDIIEGVKSYKSLDRRFTKLSDEPLIIDDFAHNPDGIKSTIKETAKLVPEGSKLHIVCSIRGSRGVDINKMNAEALADSIKENMDLYISSSIDVVNYLNVVEDEEREVFFKILNDNNIKFTHFNNLEDVLKNVLSKSKKDDVILLIGAQGMDPAESILKDIL